MDMVRRIWEKYGFYVAIALCVAALGVITVLLRGAGNRQRMMVEALPTGEPIAVGQAYGIVDSLADVTADAAPGFGWPVGSSVVLADYSPYAPIWSDTLRQWQTHVGMDIQAAQGQAVCAAADGQVIACYKSDSMGNVIAIDHGEGWVSRYAALGSLELVEVGEQVTRGQTISFAGNSADSESQLGGHLHFEIEKDGAAIDPISVLEN